MLPKLVAMPKPDEMMMKLPKAILLIAMLPLEPEADTPLPTPKTPLSSTLAVPVFNNRSPNTHAVPALLINTAMLPKLVAMPMTNKMVMELPKAVQPSPH
jgi:hypothetical protein